MLCDPLCHLVCFIQSRHVCLVTLQFVDIGLSSNIAYLQGLAAAHDVTTLPAFHLWKDQVAVEVRLLSGG